MARGLFAAAQELADASVDTRLTSGRLRRVRLGLGGAWLSGLVLWTRFFGPPVDLLPVFLWLVLAMLILSIGNPLGWAKSMIIDWLPLYGLLLAYRIVWGLVDGLGLRPHVEPHLAFDQAIFGDRGVTDLLQNRFWNDGDLQFYDWLAWAVHLSHFWVTLAVCAWLWARSRDAFLEYRRRVLFVWAMSLIIYAIYPSVPPWMAAEQGHLPPMSEVIGVFWQRVAEFSVASPLSNADGTLGLYNPVAAVPSMHSAMPMILTLYFWNRAVRWRLLLAAYPVAMGLVLMYAGEHYLFDVLAGWVVAAAAVIFCGRWERQRRSVADDRSTATQAVRAEEAEVAQRGGVSTTL